MNKNNSLIRGLAAGIGISIGAMLPASAAKPVAIEKDLLGVRVLQNYREVLRRYGAPTRVFRATESVTYQEVVTLNGVGTGGIVGIADGASTGGSGGGAMGAMAMGGRGGQMGTAMMPGGRGGAGQSGGGPAPSLNPGMMSGGSSAPPGQSPMAGGNSGGGGGGAQAGDNPDGSYSESGGFTWVYLFPAKKLAYEFHFNKDGRVERIAELGNAFGQHTSRGIGLGDTLEKVYNVYGWTDRIKEEEPGKFSLLYNDKYHAQFLVLKKKVVAISVFLKENQFMRFDGSPGGSGMMAGASGGQGGMMGQGGGMMGMGGGAPRMGGGQDSMGSLGGGGGKGGKMPSLGKVSQ